MRVSAPRTFGVWGASWAGAVVCASLLASGCDEDSEAVDATASIPDVRVDDTPAGESSLRDVTHSSTFDAAAPDAPTPDIAAPDAPPAPTPDAAPDAAPDASTLDASTLDAPTLDASTLDASTLDAPTPDAACPTATLRAATGFTDLTPSVESVLPTVPPAASLGNAMLSFGVIGDLDGDGAMDVVVGNELGPGVSTVLRYNVATGALAPIDGPWRVWRRAVRGVLDLDGDGRDDLVGVLDDTLSTPVIWGGAAAPSSLFDPRAVVIASSLWFDDVDHDGWLDVLVGDESYGCGMVGVVRAFLQVRPRTFQDRPGMIPSRVRVGGGAIVSGPVASRYMIGTVGEPHVCPAGSTFFAEGARDVDGYPTFAPATVIDDSWGGPMGATIADFDQDGWFDVAVTTDPQVRLWRGGPTLPLDAVGDAFGMSLLHGRMGRPQLPWAIAHVDLDRDGALDVVVTHGNHAVSAGELPIGPQWTAVYQGAAGTACLREVDGAFGLARDGDWHTLSVGDLDGDGDADLVVGGRGVSARIYRNDIPNTHRGLALRLHGTTSNPLGVGARVDTRVTPTSPVQHQLVGGASAVVFSTPMAFVGLGASVAAAEVTVRWPSGTVQVLRDLAAGRVHEVSEPPVLAVEPAGRHLPADGASVARLRVTPRDASGLPRAGATVSARLVSGRGALDVSSSSDGGAVVTLTAPREPGSSVLEVSIDGQPVGVRPRIWWE